MLEADEVDVDYFTPVTSTSLAKIFNYDAKLENDDNPSLKYVPKSPQDLSQNHEDSKATKIIHACAFYGYEWINNTYVSKGKIGAAILKTLKSEHYSILLYDSNKETLSCTNISTEFEVVIKEKTNISFYDYLKKYWSLYGTEAEICTFVNKLIAVNVSIKKLTKTDTDPTEINTSDTQDISNQTIADKASDTDSTINKRTKDSILKRMATMGHSVLPIQTTNFQNYDDSSNSDESTQKIIRHKPQKNNQKKIPPETKDSVDSSYKDVDLKIAPQFTDNIPRTSYDHQLVPIKSTNIINNPVVNNPNELNLFMSEQRINNSELRINVNRVSDKVDKILETVQRIGDQSNNNVGQGFQNKIVQKLLEEYENKIKAYEVFLKIKGFDCNSILKSSHEDETLKNKEFYETEIQELQNLIEKEKLETIKANNELKRIQEKYRILYKEKEENYEKHFKEICTLKNELELKNEEITKISKIVEANPSQNINKLETKLKLIMNNTFHSLSSNFNSNENYTGDVIKSLMANVIKKETTEALKEM